MTDPPEVGELVVLINDTVLGTFGRDQASLTVDLSAITSGPTAVVVQIRSGEEILASASVGIELNHLDGATGPDDLKDRFEAGQISTDEYLVNGMAALTVSSEEGTSVTLSEEFTTDVLSMALETWGDASDGAKQAIIEMATPELVPDAGAGLRAAAVTCPMSGPYVWALAGIRGSNFCEYKVDPSIMPADLIPAGVSRASLTEIVFLVDPALDGTTVGTDGGLSLGNSGIPFPLAQAAKRMWEAEALFEGMGLNLPESHRDDGVPIHVFVVNNGLPAFSSPFNERSLGNELGWLSGQRKFGHPIRVNTGHLSKTIIHEFFHTFEWDTINWANDVVLSSETGRTVVLYESGANWGTHEFSRQDDRGWAHNFGYSLSQWLARPQQQFMQSQSGISDVVKAPNRAYAYFPAMVWLNEHAGQHGPTNQLMPSVIRALDSHAFGADPIDLIEDQVDGGLWANPGGEPMAKAWPRMWTALYLMSDDSTNTAEVFGTSEYSWSKFPTSEVGSWRASLDRSEVVSLNGDDFSTKKRPGRLADSPVTLSSANTSFSPGAYPLVAKGGAGFIDVKVDVSTGSEGYSRVTVNSVQAGRNAKFEVAVTQYGSAGYPNVCLRAGRPQFFFSNETRNAAGEVVLNIPFDSDCSDFTVALVHVDPNSGSDDFLSLNIELVDEGGITTTSIPGGEAGKPYAPFTFAAANPAPTWSIVSGVLPEGLELNSAGILSGKPKTGGAYAFGVQASSPGGASPTRDFTMTVVGPRSLPDLPGGEVGVDYSQTVTAEAYYPSISPTDPTRPTITSFGQGLDSLPPGLNLDEATGVVSGRPIVDGDFAFTILVHDSIGNTGSRDYVLTIGAADRAWIDVQTVLSPDPVVPGQPATASTTVTNTGGVTADNVVTRFRLPEGFTSVVAPGCVLLAGHSTVYDCALGDLGPGASADFVVTFDVPPSFDGSVPVFRSGDRRPVFVTPWALPAVWGEPGEEYGFLFEAHDPDGDDAGLKYRIISGLRYAPPGFVLGEDGILSGLLPSGPNQNAFYWTFKVLVVDSTGAAAVKEFYMAINPQL